MKHTYFGRKQRQLRHRVKLLKALLKDDQHQAQREIAVLINKIRTLVKALSNGLSGFQLKKILGPAAVILGLSFTSNVSAQTFAAPLKNPFGLVSTNSEAALPAFVDLDGDGDIDVMAGEYTSAGDGSWHYQKNTGTPTNPQFDPTVLNPFALVSKPVTYPHFVDIDGDGDLDLVSVQDYGLDFFKNTGTALNPQFDAPVMNPYGISFQDYTGFPAFADIDGDGDQDFVVAFGYGIKFFENIGTATSPQFAAPVNDPFGLMSTEYGFFPAFADVDGDGDQDLLMGELYGTMQYYKNIGTPTAPQFEAPVQNPFGLVSTDYYAVPTFADLDNDGDQDLLVGEYHGHLEYFENKSSVGTHSAYANIQLEMFPNPVSDVLSIKTETPFERIEVYDVLGKLQGSYDGTVVSINVHDWPAGTYLFQFLDAKGASVTRKVEKK